MLQVVGNIYFFIILTPFFICLISRLCNFRSRFRIVVENNKNLLAELKTA